MKRVKGLKGRYFNLHAIMAVSTSVTLEKEKSALFAGASLRSGSKQSTEDEEDEAPPGLLETPSECLLAVFTNNKPCHCCKVFTLRSHLVLFYNRFLKRLDFDHGHRESGLSPPSPR